MEFSFFLQHQRRGTAAAAQVTAQLNIHLEAPVSTKTV
jgi:hypothetical protein